MNGVEGAASFQNVWSQSTKHLIDKNVKVRTEQFPDTYINAFNLLYAKSRALLRKCLAS